MVRRIRKVKTNTKTIDAEVIVVISDTRGVSIVLIEHVASTTSLQLEMSDRIFIRAQRTVKSTFLYPRKFR